MTTINQRVSRIEHALNSLLINQDEEQTPMNRYMRMINQRNTNKPSGTKYAPDEAYRIMTNT